MLSPAIPIETIGRLPVIAGALGHGSRAFSEEVTKKPGLGVRL